jgi:hypothetical protein
MQYFIFAKHFYLISYFTILCATPNPSFSSHKLEEKKFKIHEKFGDIVTGFM